jgi:hypothetical protein
MGLPRKRLGIVAGVLLFAFCTATARSQTQLKDDPTKDKAEVAKNRFSFGGKVEVLALGTHAEDPDRWWDKDGKPLAALPAPLVGCLVRQADEEGNPLASLPIAWKKGGQAVARDLVWRRIVIRIHDLRDDAQVRWNVTVEGERAPKGWFTQYFGLPANKKTVALKVGVATGEWKTAAKAQPFSLSAIGMRDKSIVFSRTLDTSEGAVIVVAHNYFDQNFRLVAYDKQATLHLSAPSGAAGAGNIYQMEGTFPNLQRDDIDRFEFQTRDYEFIEVADLPLDPPQDSGEHR